MLHMAFSIRKILENFSLQKFGFFMLNKKETHLTCQILQEPFETFHALA